jgi:hypothetical protein
MVKVQREEGGVFTTQNHFFENLEVAENWVFSNQIQGDVRIFDENGDTVYHNFFDTVPAVEPVVEEVVEETTETVETTTDAEAPVEETVAPVKKTRRKTV